ncbi:MAG: carbohydrate ABC transporter permease [Clostridiaceae bacterium]|nr:carbohydrate ABC transporter permease [Clostridiaceae bacterium]
MRATAANVKQVKLQNCKFIEKALNFIKTPRRIKSRVARLAMYVLLFDLVFVFVFPFLYMLVTSLKTNADLNDLTVNWVPSRLKFYNYVFAYRILDYWRFFKNSLFLTAATTTGHVLACSFVGYGFARYNFLGKKFLFFFVIVALIVPVQTLIIPTYILFSTMKWLNTYLPLIVPTFFGFGLKGALFVFIFRQFYLNLPKEIEDAAKIDGCGFLRTYWEIVLPIAQSAFWVTIVLSIVWHWNDF